MITGSSTPPPDLRLGRALADCMLVRAGWCHRKVDSLSLLEGTMGRRRVSLDCTPPPDPRLAYTPSERGFRDIAQVKGLVMVPLTIADKAVMKSLDVRGPSALPLPLLTRPEDGFAAYSALAVAFRDALGVRTLRKPLLEALFKVVHEPLSKAQKIALALLGKGEYRGEKVLDPVRLHGPLMQLCLDLAQGFMLICLIPAADAGVRQVLKYSFHWRLDHKSRLTWVARAAVAFGFAEVGVPISAPRVADASSYHLEVQAPLGLTCGRLELPLGRGVDAGNEDLVHAHASYVDEPYEDARLLVSVPRRGLRTTTTMVSSFTAMVFVLAQVLHHGRAALEQRADGAAAILLAVPAVVIALLAREGESTFASAMLRPLRGVVLVCALALVLAAFSLVGHLHAPYIGWLWRSSSALFTLLAAPLLLSILSEA